MPESADRPNVILSPEKMTYEVADEVMAHMAVRYRALGFYEFGGRLIRIAEYTPPPSAAVQPLIRRERGAIILVTATPAMLVDRLTREIKFFLPMMVKKAGLAEKQSEFKPVDCPFKVALAILSRVGEWPVPTLRGTIEAPVFCGDGRILSRPGFDEATGLLLNSAVRWLSVPEAPSRSEVNTAVRTIIEPFRQFPYIKEAHLAVHVSAILTGIERRLLPAAPCHVYDAPLQSSGKSLQAECIGLIMSGRAPASTPYSADEEEMRKKLTSTLLAGDAVCVFDNITGWVKSAALAMALTQSMYGDRLLGTNSQPKLPTNALFLLTGNNIQLVGDMPSRAVIARIDPQTEYPQGRTFKIADLRDHVLQQRPQLVGAAITILRAFYKAGRPMPPNFAASRYGEWDRTIRAPIIWTGLSDPYTTQDTINVSDPERSAAAALFAAWHSNFGERALRLAEVIAEAEPPKDHEPDEMQKQLKAALLEVAGEKDDPGKVSLRRLSAWAREHCDRIIEHRCLRKAPGVAHGGSIAWKITEAPADTLFDYAADETLNRFSENGGGPA